MITYNDALAYCKKNGKNIETIKNDFEMLDNSDGNGPSIRAWNVSGLSEPTQVEIDALTQTEKDDALTELDAPFYKKQKIDLKMTVDAGNALSLDMSAEQAELTALLA